MIEINLKTSLIAQKREKGKEREEKEKEKNFHIWERCQALVAQCLRGKLWGGKSLWPSKENWFSLFFEFLLWGGKIVHCSRRFDFDFRLFCGFRHALDFVSKVISLESSGFRLHQLPRKESSKLYRQRTIKYCFHIVRFHKINCFKILSLFNVENFFFQSLRKTKTLFLKKKFCIFFLKSYLVTTFYLS